jgi:tetratricopeptide (TPR) repeat protein
MANKKSDYEVELQRIDSAIAEVESTPPTLPLDSERTTKSLYLLYQRASLTGDLAAAAIVETALKEAIQGIGPAGDLYYLKANLDFKFHRLADVRRDLETGRELRESVQARTLLADLDFQEGRYEMARRGYEALIHDDRTWDNLARLAYLKFKMGDVRGAEQTYVDAGNELTAKEMRHYAWVELQRGVLKLRSGCYEEAGAHYQVAERAYSGYWLVDEHLAELLGAQGKFDEAIAIYQELIEYLPRPEFQQALGELYSCVGNPRQADVWHEKALTAYLDSAQRGCVHYYHHLTDFYADVRQDGPAAVKWARKDVELRKNFSTLAALAWGLYRAGEFAESLDIINEALSSGARDAQLFFQAGMIHNAASATVKGGEYLRMAAEVNPRYEDFHVHR